jgi:hypothetical protein
MLRAVASAAILILALTAQASTTPRPARLAAIEPAGPSTMTPRASSPSPQGDGLEAWQSIYSVLTHPRCLNCHTSTSYPQQGDDRHRHLFNVVRGPHGMGVPGLVCATCHQRANADSTGVPGGPGWHLAPLSMAWQDASDRAMSAGELCRALTDRAKNGGMSGAALLGHHENAALVLWAWQAGRREDGTARTPPPLTHDQFVDATRRWVAAGMPCP